MDELTFKIVSAICTLLVIGFAYLIIYLRDKNDKFDEFCTWIEKAVKAAEKIFPGSGTGKEKKEFVIKFISEVTSKLNIKITDEQIEILIESAVQDLDEVKKKEG